MYLLTKPKLAPKTACPYIEGEDFTQEYFFASDLSREDLDIILENGWRKFGRYFFRPSCHQCMKCLPLRVSVNDFNPSKGQGKVLRKNSDLIIKKNELEFKEEYYQIYLQHNERFKKADNHSESKEEFKEGFFQKSCESFILTYSLNNKVIAWGILDQGIDSLSSVYFAFNPEYSDRSLGNFGALVELDYAKESGLTHYYLGYFVESNKSMSYKANYRPYQLLNWSLAQWINK